MEINNTKGAHAPAKEGEICLNFFKILKNSSTFVNLNLEKCQKFY